MSTQVMEAVKEVEVTEVPVAIVYLTILAGVILLSVGMVIVAGL